MGKTVKQYFFRKLWDLSEWSGIGFHRLGISAHYIFERAFNLNKNSEVDHFGRKL